MPGGRATRWHAGECDSRRPGAPAPHPTPGPPPSTSELPRVATGGAGAQAGLGSAFGSRRRVQPRILARRRGRPARAGPSRAERASDATSVPEDHPRGLQSAWGRQWLAAAAPLALPASRVASPARVGTRRDERALGFGLGLGLLVRASRVALALLPVARRPTLPLACCAVAVLRPALQVGCRHFAPRGAAGCGPQEGQPLDVQGRPRWVLHGHVAC